tara:strand:+ start:160 stop:369 length:210 start_codon:yes stop_codon:yes gene_type:complete
MGYQVSRCCGADYEEQGNEDRFNFYVCTSCNEEFDEPIMNYDYNGLAKMDREEMENDEYRIKMSRIPFG